MNNVASQAQPYRVQLASQGRVASLSMTELTFLFAMLLALLVIITAEGFGWRLERIAITKHLPYLFALVPLLLTLAGWRLFRPREQAIKVLPVLRPLMVFALFVIAGGLYARITLDQSNTFMTAGLYIWAAPLAATLLVRSDCPQRLLRGFFFALLIASGIAFYGLVEKYGSGNTYHELEFLFPPLAVLAVFAAKNPWLRWGGVLFFLAIALLFKKNTGYMAVLLIAAYLTFFYLYPRWQRMKDIRKTSTFYAFSVAVIILAGAMAFIWQNRETYLPTGNVEFRSQTYERAWEKFKESPVWGAGFAAPSTEKFVGFDTGVARNILPTHSDILDILAQGGLIGILLWAWGLGRVARRAYLAVLSPKNTIHPLAPYGHTLACMSLAGVLVYAFNPIFLQPVKSLLLWVCLGLLVGVTLLVERDRHT